MAQKKNKFYYNGELVRTSAHEYTHGAANITTGKVWGCSSSKEGAQKMIDSLISQRRTWIKDAETAIKALENHQRGYWVKEGRHSWFVKFSYCENPTVEGFQKNIEEYQRYIEWAQNNLGVVELEKR